MKVIKKIFDEVELSASVAADDNAVEVDFQRYGQTREFLFSAKTQTHASTAPGSSKTFAINYFWSDTQLTAAELIDAAVFTTNGKLIDRRVQISAQTIGNVADNVQEWEIGTTPLRPLARFMYVCLQNSAMDAPVLFTLNLVKLRSTQNRD
jgi:hypothetical protein